MIFKCIEDHTLKLISDSYYHEAFLTFIEVYKMFEQYAERNNQSNAKTRYGYIWYKTKLALYIDDKRY